MNALNALARTVGTITLCALLIGAGLFACCLRPATSLIAQATSNHDDSPYSQEALVGLATLTRDYTVDGGNRRGHARHHCPGGVRRLSRAQERIRQAGRACFGSASATP